MAEATRFKDLQAEVKTMTDHMSQLATSTKTRMDNIEANSSTRFDQLQTTLETMARTPDMRFDRIEATIEALRQNVQTTRGVAERVNEEQNTGGSSKHIKLDFPKFNGTDPMTWIFRAEQYFTYYSTPDIQWVIIASVNFEGDVVPWFQLLQRTHVITDWASLVKAIEEEYGPSVYEKPRVRLFKLMQAGSAEEYCREFMALANRTEGVSDDALLDCFTGGLKPDVRRDVMAQKPMNLLRATELAKLFDVQLGLASGQHTGPKTGNPIRSGVSQKPFTLGSAASSSSKSSLPPLLPTPAMKPFPSVKRMTPAEMAVRREKGLCYTCDEKFSPSHRCQNK